MIHTGQKDPQVWSRDQELQAECPSGGWKVAEQWPEAPGGEAAVAKAHLGMAAMGMAMLWHPPGLGEENAQGLGTTLVGGSRSTRKHSA